MDIKITPSRLDGVLEAATDKAYAHRIFIAAALSEGETEIYARSSFPEVRETLECLKKLGAFLSETGEGKYIVSPIKQEGKPVITVDESIVAVKFLVPVVAALGIEATFYSEDDSKKIDAESFCSLNGVAVNGRSFPFTVFGKLKSGRYDITSLSGTQFISGLIMALPLIDGDSEIICPPTFKNKSYIKITLDVMRRFGVDVIEEDYGFKIIGGRRYVSPKTISVPGDNSLASFIIGANAFGNRVRVTGLDPFAVGGRKIKDYILAFSAKGTVIDVKDEPESAYILSVCAVYANSKTIINNAPKNKAKEKFVRFLEGLIKAGAKITYDDGQVVIEGNGGLNGKAMVDCSGDYRAAISMCMAATLSDNEITVLSAESVLSVYPSFFNDFNSLGGKCKVL